MQLVPNAGRIALRSYSMWSQYLGLIALIVPDALWYFFQVDSNPRLWWLLAIAFIVFGIVGRLISQVKIDPTKLRSALMIPALLLAFAQVPSVPPPAAPQPATQVVTVEAFLEVAIPHVAKWEGKRNEAYLDTIAVPPVWTVCYGETRGVSQGDYFTDSQCSAKLGNALIVFRTGLHKAFEPVTIASRLTPHRDTAYTSLAYNAGISAISKSTAVKRLNAGDIEGGCEAIGWWNKAGGRVIRGLVNRRTDEVALCLL